MPTLSRIKKRVEERGLRKGLKQGLQQGLQEGLKKAVISMAKKGFSAKDINQLLDIDLETVNKWIKDKKI